MGAKSTFRKRARTALANDVSLGRTQTMKSITFGDIDHEDMLDRSFESSASSDSAASGPSTAKAKTRKNLFAATTSLSEPPLASKQSSFSSHALASLDGLAVNFVKYRYPNARHFKERKWGELKATILCLRAMRAYADCNAATWKRTKGRIEGTTKPSREPVSKESYRDEPAKLQRNPISMLGGISWHSQWKSEEADSAIAIRYGSFKSPLLYWEPEAAGCILRGLEDATFAVMAREEDLDESCELGVASDVRVLIALPFNGDAGYSHRKKHIAMKLLNSSNRSRRYCVVLPASPYYFYREGKTWSGKAISEGVAQCVGAVSEYYVKGVALAAEAASLLRHLYFGGYRRLGIVGTSLGGYSCAMAASLAQVPVAIAACFVAMDGGIVVNGVLGKIVDWTSLHSTINDCGSWEPHPGWEDEAMPKCSCAMRKGKKASRKEWMRCTKSAWSKVSELTSLRHVPQPVLAHNSVVVGAKKDGFVGQGAAQVAEMWNCHYWEVRGGHASGIVFGDNGVAAATTSFQLMGL